MLIYDEVREKAAVASICLEGLRKTKYLSR